MDLAGLGYVSLTDQSINATGWSWDFGDGSPNSTMQHPSHVYVDTGIFTISLTATNYNCSDFSLSYIVVIDTKSEFPPDTTISLDNGGNDLSIIENLLVFPNPTTDHLIVIAREMISADHKLELISLIGKQAIVENNPFKNKRRYLLRLSGLSKGTYILKTSTKNTTIATKKIVIN